MSALPYQLISKILFLTWLTLILPKYENLDGRNILSQPPSESSQNHPLSSFVHAARSVSARSPGTPLVRKKRFIWMSHDKKFVLPPGTQFVFSPTVAMPFIRHPPTGITSNFTMSFPFTFAMDDFGMTHNDNPIGVMPFLIPGTGILGGKKKKRRRSFVNRNFDEDEIDLENLIFEDLMNTDPMLIKGGERAAIYASIEDLLESFGRDGRACLLRTICEVHESPFKGYGLFGEIFKLILTPSLSSYKKRLKEHIEAEKVGRLKGECWPYYKACKKSLFGNVYKWRMKRISEEESDEDNGENDVFFHPPLAMK